MSVKVILDTDIGTDIDDAICLAYLLANSNCELMGITTVTGEPEKRAMLASSLCKIAKKNVPIYPGTANPILIEQQQKIAKQSKSLDKWDHEKKFLKGEAINFLQKTIKENPGEIVLLTIGPLTNIGLLFSIDPEIPQLLKSIVMMCGYFEHKIEGWNKLEWNAKGDYHASDIVYKASVSVHRSIGIDVTSQVKMSSDEFKNKFTADIFKPLHDYAEHWYAHSNTVTFHDPLAAVTIFNENICEFKRGNVSIEMDDKNNLGLTKWELSENGRNEIAFSVNKDKFFEEYFSVFG
ncbi:MAG: nucleoside hydrolase [Ignavibacteriaceae bacterium]